MRFGRRRHRHRKAADQLVMRLGAVVPAQELVQGHRLDRKLSHNRLSVPRWICAAPPYKIVERAAPFFQRSAHNNRSVRAVSDNIRALKISPPPGLSRGATSLLENEGT